MHEILCCPGGRNAMQSLVIVSSHPSWACIQLVDMCWFLISNLIHTDPVMPMLQKLFHKDEIVDTNLGDVCETSNFPFCTMM
jgi:hypothetical protein